MDERIAEIMSLIPEDTFKKGVISGINDQAIVDHLERRVRDVHVKGLDELGDDEMGTFDLALAVFHKCPDEGLIQKSVNAVNSRGIVVFILPFSSGAAKKMKSLPGNTQIYGLSPSIDDIRLIVPLNNSACAAASLALYQPSLFLAKTRKFIAYWLARMGFPEAWTPWFAVVSVKSHTREYRGIRPVISKYFGPSAELALFTGTPGYLRKPTLQIMDPGGTILGYCKIGYNDQTRAMIRNEARILEFLSGVDLGDSFVVPDAVYFGDIFESATVLMQSTAKRHLSAAPMRPGSMHASFLNTLFETTKSNRRFLETDACSEVASRIASTARSREDDVLTDAIRWCSETIDRANVPVCLAHRDLTPWNTFVSDGRLYVFDWEFSRHDWNPLSDAFHLVIQKGILVDHAKEDELWSKITMDNSREGAFLKTCAVNTGVVENAAVYYALMTHYLLDMITMYTSRQEFRNSTANEQSLLVYWRGLLDRIIQTKLNGRL